jgi:hypothetical protein
MTIRNVGKPLAPIGRVPGQRDPPVFPELPEGLPELGRAGDLSPVELHPPRLADFLERIHHPLGQADGLRDHHIEHLFAEIPVTIESAQGSVVQLILQDKKDVIPIDLVVRHGEPPLLRIILHSRLMKRLAVNHTSSL